MKKAAKASTGVAAGHGVSGSVAANSIDAAYDALINDAPVLKDWTAEQDKGSYDITLRGVPGAYFIQALEYDDIGLFDTESEAKDAVYANFGEFLIECDGDA